MPLLACCMSHSPVRDLVHPPAEVEARAREALAEARHLVEDFDPDLVVIFGPDHFNHYSYESMPAFSVGLSASSVADFGAVPTEADVPWRVARDLAGAILEDGVDVAVAERVSLDHAYSQPVETVLGSIGARPLIPVFVNCLGVPLGPPRRARLLGEAAGRFLAGLGRRVLVMGSGGLSHHLPPFFDVDAQAPEKFLAKRQSTPADFEAKTAWISGVAERIGAGSGELPPPNADFDEALLDLLQKQELERVDDLRTGAITEQAGIGGQEVRTWLATYAALGSTGPYETRLRYYEVIPHWLCGFGVTVAEASRD